MSFEFEVYICSLVLMLPCFHDRKLEIFEFRLNFLIG
jgi:hypothetical protein